MNKTNNFCWQIIFFFVILKSIEMKESEIKILMMNILKKTKNGHYQARLLGSNFEVSRQEVEDAILKGAAYFKVNQPIGSVKALDARFG